MRAARSWSGESPRAEQGVDGTEGAEHALKWALREAGARGLPLTAALAWESAARLSDEAHLASEPADSEAQARRTLDLYIVQTIGDEAAAGVQRHTERHPAPRALLDAAVGASLLVVGSRGLGGLGRLVLGSVSECCLHYTPCPLAIVYRTDTAIDGEMARVVVGIDGSEAARVALEWAAQQAALHKASLEIVHAWKLPYGYGMPSTSAGLDPSRIEEGARAILDAAVESVDADVLSAPVEATLVAGGAAAAILERAKGADLVVVGSRGLGGFAGLLIGSVGHQVAHHATTPVVVVPKTELT